MNDAIFKTFSGIPVYCIEEPLCIDKEGSLYFKSHNNKLLDISALGNEFNFLMNNAQNINPSSKKMNEIKRSFYQLNNCYCDGYHIEFSSLDIIDSGQINTEPFTIQDDPHFDSLTISFRGHEVILRLFEHLDNFLECNLAADHETKKMIAALFKAYHGCVDFYLDFNVLIEKVRSQAIRYQSKLTV